MAAAPPINSSKGAIVFIPATIGKGDKVQLWNDVKVIKGTFTAGHQFTVIAVGERGLDVIDSDGNTLLECDYNNFKKLS